MEKQGFTESAALAAAIRKQDAEVTRALEANTEIRHLPHSTLETTPCRAYGQPTRNMKTHGNLFALTAILALLPLPALANAGTPLMWLTMFHLVIGNTFVGLIEALCYARLFKAPIGKSILMLITANYASAWTGVLFVLLFPNLFASTTVEDLYASRLFYVVAFITILVVEYFFFQFIIRDRKDAASTALKATLVINTISCVFIAVVYLPF